MKINFLDLHNLSDLRDTLKFRCQIKTFILEENILQKKLKSPKCIRAQQEL